MNKVPSRSAWTDGYFVWGVVTGAAIVLLVDLIRLLYVWALIAAHD